MGLTGIKKFVWTRQPIFFTFGPRTMHRSCTLINLDLGSPKLFQKNTVPARFASEKGTMKGNKFGKHGF